MIKTLDGQEIEPKVGQVWGMRNADPMFTINAVSGDRISGTRSDVDGSFERTLNGGVVYGEGPSSVDLVTLLGQPANAPRQTGFARVVEENEPVFQQASTGAKREKMDQRYDLFPVEAMEVVCDVLEHGAAKYGPRNWEKGLPMCQLTASTMRHLKALERGEDLDPDSGLPHIGHIACNAMFLAHHHKTGKFEPETGLDDRR